MKELILSRPGLLLLVGLFLWGLPQPFAVFAVIGFVFAFTAIDVFGFQPEVMISIDGDMTSEKLSKEKRLAVYRVMQGAFEAAMLIPLWHRFGFGAMLAAAVLHYFLVCDILFYFVKGIPLQPFTWFKVNPIVALFNYVFKRPAPVWSLWVSAGIGVMIACWLLF